MPRNSSGSMSPANGPYLSGTTISSTAVNARFADIETEITSSLDRTGRGGMTGPLRTADGTVAAPSHAFTNDTGSGLYRAGAGDIRVAVGGVDALKLVAGGVSGPINLVSGTTGMIVTLTGGFALVQGNAGAASTAWPDVVLTSTLVRTAGLLMQVQNSGAGRLDVDYQGLLRLTAPAAAIQPASIWTAATLNAGWTGTVSYFKDATGRVQIKGAASFATGGAAAAFNLPAGFRAGKFIPIMDWSNSTTVPASVDVTSGAVAVIPSGGPVNLHLYYFDSISFIAEA